MATGDVGRRVDVRLVLHHPTLIVHASERRLRRPRTEVAAGVARLGRVCRVHLLHRDTRFEGFVFDGSGEPCERPVVETAVHPFVIVEMLVDVRQVFENNNGVLELTCVLNGLARGLLHHVCEGVLVVIESFVHAPLGVARLETAEVMNISLQRCRARSPS
ncbi:MAG: hypothetical protein J07HQX50_02842 [Haloquadratum sp. J07HQX50]|nr:MAG: hypothetical protein J07HQX50_02842 [Haloquadratum sp. J07HQX50]